jgi:UDP-N-acetylmuramoyl-tripeptide--D-alanyl-D-alanine ligase
MKKLAKRFVLRILSWQIRRLRKKHTFKAIAVTGSTGKTSTKLAVASVLSKHYRVRFQDGTYDDILGTPLVYFGQELPARANPFTWWKLLLANEKQIKNEYPFDFVVLEYAPSLPGSITQFKQYGQLDVGIITSISPYALDVFTDLDTLAAEIKSIVEFSTTIIYNADLVPEPYRTGLPEGAISYGIKEPADFHLANIFHSANGFEGDIKHGEGIYLHIGHEVVSEMQLYSMLAATVAGWSNEMRVSEITAGIANIHPLSGRLRRLRGINNATIIDDTYDANPTTMKAALDSLYASTASQKIAVLGSMYGLGAASAEAHSDVGEYCDPNQLAMVVTIGKEANSYLAAAAEAKGCSIRKFDNPYRAGEFLQTFIQNDACVLVKGSADDVFTEETVKLILADPEDAGKLVRQSPEMLRKKKAVFKEA